MIVNWIRDRRVFRERVLAEADRLQADHGRAAYATAAIAARSPQADWRLAEAVRDEIGRRIGYRPRAEIRAPHYLARAS